MPTISEILYSRTTDYILAVFFALFVFISTFIELPVCFGYPVDKHSSILSLQYSYTWCEILGADRIFVQMPVWAKVC